jgi:nicotinic acid mononucleotide adenylyltransferase
VSLPKSETAEEFRPPPGDASGAEAVLVLGGAFNPVHTQHIALMHLVKEVVEAEHNYAIRAGYLAVAPDGYVRTKLKDRAMKGEHRLAMCNLALQGSDWLLPCDRTYGSAPECGLRRRRHAGIRVLVVLGADRAMGRPERAKWRRHAREGMVTVCVGRAGESRRVQEQYRIDLREGLVPDPHSFLFVIPEVGAVSSTLVRSELHRVHAAATAQEKREAARRLTDRGLLHPLVAAYVLKHEPDLYLT